VIGAPPVVTAPSQSAGRLLFGPPQFWVEPPIRITAERVDHGLGRQPIGGLLRFVRPRYHANPLLCMKTVFYLNEPGRLEKTFVELHPTHEILRHPASTPFAQPHFCSYPAAEPRARWRHQCRVVLASTSAARPASITHGWGSTPLASVPTPSTASANRSVAGSAASRSRDAEWRYSGSSRRT
jgi:hypothetical protein